MKNTFFLLALQILIFPLSAQNLNVEWVFPDSSANDDVFSTSIAVDDAGNIYNSGAFKATMDFDPGPGVVNLTSQADYDLYIRKLDSDGNLIWLKQIRSDGNMAAGEIVIDSMGNLYMAGLFQGAADFDPGPDTFLISGNNNYFDSYVMKLDSTGSLINAFALHAKYSMGRPFVRPDGLGNIYLTGMFKDSADFDPRPGFTQIEVANTGDELFLMKLDSGLSPIWFKKMLNKPGVVRKNIPSALKLAPSGNLYIQALFRSPIDVDPDTGEYILTPMGWYDSYVCKFDTSGNFNWARQIRSDQPVNNRNIQISATEEITSMVSGSGFIDLDPDTSIAAYQGGFNPIFFQRLDSAGNFLWGKVLNRNDGLPHVVDANWGGFKSDQNGNIFLLGEFSRTIDFDLGPGIYNLQAIPDSNDYSAFLAKYDADFNLIWAEPFERINYPPGGIIALDHNDNIILSSSFVGTVDFDPGPDSIIHTPAGTKDLFIMKLSQSCGDLTLLIDQVFDQTCSGPGFGLGHALNGTPPYQYSWSNNPMANDSTATFASGGIFALTVTDFAGCSRTKEVLVNGPDTMLTPEPRANLLASDFRPGFPAILWVDAFNTTCTPFTGELVLILDPLVQYDSASVPPDTIVGDSLIWNVSNLVYGGAHLLSRIHVTTSLQTEIGDLLCFDLGFPVSSNPSFSRGLARNYCYEVQGSYDPNDKQVYPQGNCEESYVQADEPLTYTVRFQNTGNADAINVFILDTLDANLDIDSVKILGRSHVPMITEVLAGGVLKFRFDHIQLPDSNSNEPLSHGYVIYEGMPKAGLTTPIPVENRASIYFDFNEPVITNTVQNTLITSVPPVDTSLLQVNTCEEYLLNNRVYTQSGTYHQHVSSSLGCDSVLELSLTIQPLDTNLMLAGDTLWANETNASYQWLDCDNGNVPVPGANQAFYVPDSSGSYAVLLENGNCSDTSACIQFTLTGMAQFWPHPLKAYPNPAREKVELDLGEMVSQIELSISNALGQTLSIDRFSNKNRLSIDLPQAPGLYFFQLRLDGKTGLTKVLRQ